ncbi:DUF4219 domain-containing protein [Tanacetum coccineum]
MESEKYLEGQSMQRPPLFESDGFIYWKNRFETYVKSKDLDLWHVITFGDFPPIQNNPETKKDEIVPFDKQNDDLKKKLAKNNEAKMVIYNALPRKEYERIFMCKTAKEIWDTLLITHQGNSQVKDNKIDLLVQQYEQFTIPEEESIDNAFARFNTIITSLKALDEGKSKRKCFRCGDPNHFIGECPKSSRSYNKKAFIGRAWSDSGEDEEEKAKDETCLVAQASNEIFLGINLEPGEWIKDSGCSKHMMGNRKLFSTYKAYNGGNVIFGSNFRGNIIGKVEESLNVTFDETPLMSKTSPLEDDDLVGEEAIEPRFSRSGSYSGSFSSLQDRDRKVGSGSLDSTIMLLS